MGDSNREIGGRNTVVNEGNASFLSHKAYAYVQDQLVRGRWGLNERISEKTIADELGISRTPVREAIRKMISEGLLYQVPSSGTFVTNPDRQSISEMFEVRMALEGLAVEKAAELIYSSLQFSQFRRRHH